MSFHRKTLGWNIPPGSGVGRDRRQDLHGHGHAGDLSHGVGQGAGGRPQGEQVGHAVQHPAQEEDQEVEAGHRQRGARHGVDGAQEEEGVDVLHVVVVSSREEMKEENVTQIPDDADVSLIFLGRVTQRCGFTV